MNEWITWYLRCKKKPQSSFLQLCSAYKMMFSLKLKCRCGFPFTGPVVLSITLVSQVKPNFELFMLNELLISQPLHTSYFTCQLLIGSITRHTWRWGFLFMLIENDRRIWIERYGQHTQTNFLLDFWNTYHLYISRRRCPVLSTEWLRPQKDFMFTHSSIQVKMSGMLWWLEKVLSSNKIKN